MKKHFLYTMLIAISSMGSMSYAQIAPQSNENIVKNDTLHQVLTTEQARQAILQMTGKYKVDFRFEELYGLQADYKIKKPDLSSGYETVIVLENSPTKVSLQHLLVADGFVVKHWRQDWEYQPSKMWVYAGNYSWKTVQLSPEQSKGKWLQTVWQVDDSPRYAGLGQWQKNNGVTEWTSDETYRPLPRREHTTRDDYDLIIGTNRHAITANGWMHEQDNIKFDTKTQQPLARELGINQYRKVKDYDFKPAYDYWKNNADYWAAVRSTWQKALDQNAQVALKFAEDGEKSHFSYFMDQAKTVSGKKVSAAQLQKQTQDLLNQQLQQGRIK